MTNPNGSTYAAIAGGLAAKAREIASDSVGYNPWFCVYTEPTQEYRVFNGLAEVGIKGYFPRILTEQRRYGRVESVVRPLCPRYVLASFDPDGDEWGKIRDLRGSRGLLRAPSGRPQRCRPGEVERLQARGRAGDGVICEGLPGMAPMLIEPGAVVRPIADNFVDWTGVCKWSEAQRVGVLMTIFGREQVVAMDRAKVRVVV